MKGIHPISAGIVALALIFMLLGCMSWLKGRSTNAGLPMVEVTDASARRGFVCTTVVTPKLGPDRQRTWT